MSDDPGYISNTDLDEFDDFFRRMGLELLDGDAADLQNVLECTGWAVEKIRVDGDRTHCFGEREFYLGYYDSENVRVIKRAPQARITMSGDDDDDMVECVFCHRRAAGLLKTWPPGWGCLYGSLACCSRTCAESYARDLGNAGLDDDDYDED